MDGTIYSLLAGNISEYNRAKNLSNDTANAQTDGYKSEKLHFRSILTNDVIDDKLALPQDYASTVNMKQGSQKHTGHWLDMMINGNGFFLVNTPRGIRYTRQGHYYRNTNGVIQTAQGYPLLSTEGAPIILNERDFEVLITRDGEIFAKYYDGDGSNSTIRQEFRAKISIVDIVNPKLLQKEEEGLMIIAKNNNDGGWNEIDFTTAQNMQYVFAAQNSVVLQGAVENANVNVIQTMTDLVALKQRSENDSAMISNIYSIENKAYSVFANQPK